WAQEHFDQGGMLREFMKWDYELRHPEQVETILDRALAIAKSEPQGPVYVTLPREILASQFSGNFSESTTIAPASPPAPDPDPQALLPQSDLILVVDCDVPWLPSQGNPRPEAKVIHIGPDPLFARYPLRGFRTDLALTGGVAPTLDALCERTQKHAFASRVENRRQAVTAQSTATRLQARGGPAAMTPRFASQCVNRLLADDTILVNEYPILLEELTLREPMRYFGNPPSGGLGWGLGAALGAKLASPDKTLIATLGDGSYMFGNPTPGHFVGEGMLLPGLYVIFNNARWAAVHRSTLGVYPK